MKYEITFGAAREYGRKARKTRHVRKSYRARVKAAVRKEIAK